MDVQVSHPYVNYFAQDDQAKGKDSSAYQNTFDRKASESDYYMSPVPSDANLSSDDIYHPPSGIQEDQGPITSPQEVTSDKKGLVTGKPEYVKLHYTVRDVPPWYIAALLAFQHFIVMYGATVFCPLRLKDALCINDTDYRTQTFLMSTVFVSSGVSTALQTTFGVRLPIVQGGSLALVASAQAILDLPHWKCPGNFTSKPYSVESSISNPNFTMAPITVGPGDEPPFHSRMREIQGAIMVASLFQIFLGFSGFMGWLLRYIGPLAIAPTIALIGLSLFDVAADLSSKQWWITLVTILLIGGFSQFTRHIYIPCFTFHGRRGCRKDQMPIFRLFPVLLAGSIVWILCVILTVTKVFPESYGAATNLRMEFLEAADWVWFPYPGQWGTPTVSTAGVFGMVSGILASMVESVGDYYACARMSRVPPPPMHAVNRGLGVEGIACMLAGAWGSGTGTTTYSENIGVIGITKVASRRVMQIASIVMILFGIFGKFGAVFIIIPEPIIGGVFIVMFGMIVAVGLSNLQFCDLNSSRNLFILGFSFFFGLSLPKYLEGHPESIKTGSMVLDQIFRVLLGTPMFVGGLSGFLLDNIIPGTDEERGLIRWRAESFEEVVKKKGNTSQMSDGTMITLPTSRPRDIYDAPLLTRLVKRHSWAQWVPFLPTFKEEQFVEHMCQCCTRAKSKRRSRASQNMAAETNEYMDRETNTTSPV